MSSPIVQISRLDFAYADRLVLKHVDLELPCGQTLGLMGPNGGGKSTLLRLIVGLLQPTRGQVLVNNLPPCQAARCGHVIGYVPQRPLLNTQLPLSPRQILALSCTTPSQIPLLLDAVGLADLANEPIATLSAGQMQRLLIARALVNSPSLLVLDEPTTGIDATARRQFISLMQNLRQQLGLSIIMSTHDHEVMDALCHGVANLNLTLEIGIGLSKMGSTN